MKVRKRIGLYGGTFDPVHSGHVAVARALRGLFSLTEVVLIPAFIAPHKRGMSVTPALYRYAMLALATQDSPELRISTIEIDAPERPYTSETLSRMQSAYGDEASLFFVMGADSWMEITTWHEWATVLSLANHIIVSRPGYELSGPELPESVRRLVVDLRGLGSVDIEGTIARSAEHRIYLTDAVDMDVSATAIRRAVRDNAAGELSWLVPTAVAEFILKYGLYR